MDNNTDNNQDDKNPLLQRSGSESEGGTTDAPESKTSKLWNGTKNAASATSAFARQNGPKVASAARATAGGLAAVFAAAAAPAALLFMGGKKLLSVSFNLLRSRGFRSALLFSPAMLAVGQCTFSERLPVDSGEAWSYAGSKAMHNYIASGKAIINAVNWGASKTADIADATGITSSDEVQRGPVLADIPDNHLVIQCRPVYTRDVRAQNAERIFNTQSHQDQMIDQWKHEPGGFLWDSVKKGDVRITYAGYDDKVLNPKIEPMPAGSRAACGNGLIKTVTSGKKFMDGSAPQPRTY